MTVAARQAELVENYRFIENKQERLGAVVDAARTLPHLPEPCRTAASLVPGCTSRVWLWGELDGGVCRFTADCDSPLVRGLVVLLAQCYDGVTPTDARTTECTVLAELDLWRDLSGTRQNGLAAVRQRIATLAAGWC